MKDSAQKDPSHNDRSNSKANRSPHSKVTWLHEYTGELAVREPQPPNHGGAGDKAPQPDTSRSRFYHLHLDNLNAPETLAYCAAAFRGDRAHVIYFLNAHCFNTSREDSGYHQALNRCDLLLNDGIGIRIGASLQGLRLKANMNGTDFIPRLLEMAGQQREPAYLLGGRPGVAEDAARVWQKHMPELDVSGWHSGYFSKDEEESVIDAINNSGATLLVVGMGVPVQEKWIDRNRHRFTRVKVIVAGGAILDFTAGRVKRAPRWVRRLNLEWLYRLGQEPRRLFRRYVIGNVVFLRHLLADNLSSDIRS